MAEKDKELVSLELSKELHAQLKKAAKEQEISFSALVRMILKSYVQQQNGSK